MNTLKKNAIFIIPALYLIWSLQLNLVGGPFSLSRCDPEYPYLLNGLNCAILEFNNIGHTDHPGTPFQMITGLFIRVTHLAIGQGPIVQDVLARPETYLATASLFLSILTFLLLIWLGKIGMKVKGKLMGALILQSSFFLSTVLIDMPLRYNPDRFLVMYNLILAGFVITYLFTENYSSRKFAVITGILMGIGFATKFNYLPVLIIPLLLIPEFRNRVIYSLSILLAFIISILPIMTKFKEFRSFIQGVISHDGLYGHGSERMINWKSFGLNFWELISNNPAYTLILLISIGLIGYYAWNRKKVQADNQLILLMKGFLFASVIGFILVSKHFKVYYFAPVLSLAGLTLFGAWVLADAQILKKKTHSIASATATIFLIIISVWPLPAQQRDRLSLKQANLKTSEFYSDNVTLDDLMFIEPTWLAGPMVENGLIYGISYVAGRHEFYKDYQSLYPNVISWEGNDRNPGLFRTAEADPESILFCGRDIYVYSSAGRDANQLLNYIDTLAGRYGTRFSRETVFTNPVNEDKVIRVSNLDGWKTLLDSKNLLETTVLTQAAPVSDFIPIRGVVAGDYLEITLRIHKNDPDAKCRIIARSTQSDQDGIYFEDSGSLQDVGHGWQLLRLRGKVNTAPADGEMICQAYYPGTKKTTIQDLHIRHMGRR